MRSQIIFLLFILAVPFISKAALPQLSEESRAVLFTCTPGKELYAGFGHSALWIYDPATGVDRLYNFGTFDFNTPNFYGKFIRGKLDYMLTVTTAQRFLNEYQYRKIGVSSQQLQLHNDEIQRLFNLMEENLLPENRFYKYDFFYDNCATRIRDVVIKSVDGTIDFRMADEKLSFREILFPYLDTTPWTKFGINLILGLSSDLKATPYEYQYMPELMQVAFSDAVIEKENTQRKLVSDEQQVLPLNLQFKYQWWQNPALLFSLLFVLTIMLTAYEIRTKRYYKTFDIIFNSIAAAAGLFLFFMWVGTDHSATNYNLNILWLLPAPALFLLAFLIKNKKKLWLVKAAFYFQILVIIAMLFWPQATEAGFIIISLMLAFRYQLHEKLLQQ